MSDHDETAKSPEKDPGEPRKKPGIVARLKKFYEKQPVTFAISVMGGVSALLFLCGRLLSDDIDLTNWQTGPISP